VFAINTDGSSFTNLYNFSPVVQVYEGSFPMPGSSLPLPVYEYTNGDGANPQAGLILSGNTLFGTASTGGSSGNGTVFAIRTDGSCFTNLHSFIGGNEGSDPCAGLILSGNILYGTTQNSGSGGNGTVFAVNTDGTRFTNIYTFTSYNPFDLAHTNADGADPVAGLILSGDTLYGTASAGGSSGVGTVFAVKTNGLGFVNLHSFIGGNEGSDPRTGLILSGNTLYGTTRNSGSGGNGTVFAVNIDGTGFTNLYSFTGDYSINFLPNTDGSNPLSSLILLGDTLYGTTSRDGNPGVGTVFAINTDGTGLTIPYRFTGNGGTGWEPVAGLLLSGNTLYGTTLNGGASGNGTVFGLTLPLPQLTITTSGTSVLLTWPTNFTGFSLQFSTNLIPPEIWNAVHPGPALVNGQNTVTNPIAVLQEFYRLKK
jgi:uncharacterized repeat protein (TIGR03803 family)